MTETFDYDHEAFKRRMAEDPAGGYPPDFADWPPEARRKWFAANTEAILADSDHLVGRDSFVGDDTLGYFPELEDEPPEPINGRRYEPFKSAEMRRPDEGAPAPPRTITPTPFVYRAPSTIPRRQWLYGKHYVRQYVSATFAPGGLGKTSLVLVEAIAMASGRALLGVPKRLRVWYWNGEDPAEETERRIAAILLHFKIPHEEIEGWLFTDTGRKTPVCIARRQENEVIFTPDAAALTQAIVVTSIDVFILDPFVKTHGVPENDNGAVDSVAREFAEIADKTNCAVELTHHVRKAGGAGRVEVTADDGRGASSLKDAGRAVRVMNQMGEEEAKGAQVEVRDRKRYFRVDDDAKANMQAPAESADWFKIVSVPLYNDPDDQNAPGDSIGVVVKWELPGIFAGMVTGDLARVQAEIAVGDWAQNVQSDDWAGHAVAAVLDIDVSEEPGKSRVKSMLKAWIKSGALKVATKSNPNRRGHKRPSIMVGNNIVEGGVTDET